MNHLIILGFFITIIGCDNAKRDRTSTLNGEITHKNKYAEGFIIRRNGVYTEVEVVYPFQGATSGYTYLLVPRGEAAPMHQPHVQIIYTPIYSIVCTSTTHIPFLEYLNESDKLVGFPSTNYISSAVTRKRIDEGKVEELGIDKGMNLEKLAVLQPDLVMAYSTSGEYGQLKKIEELGIPVIINAEYLEKHPLGRAEWIKFIALFFNKEQTADSVFDEIERKYLATKKLIADKNLYEPTVLSGIVYGDAWFLPGGENYASRILKDAGCNYMFKDDPSHGFLELSFEHVYSKAYNADIWIGVGTYASLKEIEAADQRYTTFKAFKEKNVYTSNGRKGATGGSEFLELGYLRPDIILGDLVKIAHPEILPDYQLYFHKKLQ